MKKYEFGYWNETPDGKKWVVVASSKCASDAQAEHYVRNHIGAHGERLGLTIRRCSDRTEWFCQF
jgi:hypothetical protein